MHHILMHYTKTLLPEYSGQNSDNKNKAHRDSLERETGLEPATLSLEG